MKNQVSFFLPFLIMIWSCNEIPSEPVSLFQPDSLLFYGKKNLKYGEGWILLSEPGICWRCSGYYYFLGKEIKNKDSLELVLITHKMRRATREEMYDGINWEFSDRIRHLEDPEAFKQMAKYTPVSHRLIHIFNDSIEVFPIDNRDSMDISWSNVKHRIRED